MVSEEGRKKNVNALVDVWNGAAISQLDTCCADNLRVYHSRLLFDGVYAYAPFLNKSKESFPGAIYTVEELIFGEAGSNKATVRFRGTGRFSGVEFPAPSGKTYSASGKVITFEGLALFRFWGDAIEELRIFDE